MGEVDWDGSFNADREFFCNNFVPWGATLRWMRRDQGPKNAQVLLPRKRFATSESSLLRHFISDITPVLTAIVHSGTYFLLSLWQRSGCADPAFSHFHCAAKANVDAPQRSIGH
mmetsp:Transcript_28980/g.61252  ORF Transcript_28980/g.61252 Transcript_28980/m.61252 type:complete len:114 (+) Transcript_28980:1040-1381(+)